MTIKIINITQHHATPEQIAAGVVEVKNEPWRDAMLALLTFDNLPSRKEIGDRAYLLAAMISRYDMSDADDDDVEYPRYAMIGGAPFFMSELEAALRNYHIVPMYAFSRRESVEEIQGDGSVRKTAVFRHVGFVEV